jgi:putative nucleotidyltransferase with HDIG domain
VRAALELGAAATAPRKERRASAPLSGVAFCYLAAVIAAAAALAARAAAHPVADAADWRLFVVLTVVASAAQLRSFHVGRNRVFHPAMVFVVAAILLLPPELVAAMCLVQHVPEWLTKRYAWYIQCFNIANYTAAALTAGTVAGVVRATAPAHVEALLTGLAACAVFLALNRGLLAVMLRLARVRSFRATGLFAHEDIALELVLASMGIPLAALWLIEPSLAPIALAPLALIYYAQRSALELHRASDLIRSQNAALEDANRLLIERSTAAMESLSATVDARDAYTAGHSRRVRAISLRIGEELGLELDELETLASAALLHDIGKIAVPDAVLLKPGRLDEEEWAVMKTHAAHGASIIARLGFLESAVAAIRHHHERPDGTGYPDGLCGDEVPLLAQIIGVADALDSMLTNRVYRRAGSLESALAELRRCAGSQFSTRCVEALERALDRDGRPQVLPAYGDEQRGAA